MTLILVATGIPVLLILAYLALLDSSYQDIARHSLLSALGIGPYLIQLTLGMMLGNFRHHYPARHRLVA